MPSINMDWMSRARARYLELRDRAKRDGRLAEFDRIHGEIMDALEDLKKAEPNGERQNKTKKAGGQVRHWIHRNISVCYAVMRYQRVGWILKYESLPIVEPK